MNRLQKFRESKGLTQFQMTIKLGCSPSMYEKIERGYQPPSRGFMQKIKVAFPDASIDYLFFGGDDSEAFDLEAFKRFLP